MYNRARRSPRRRVECVNKEINNIPDLAYYINQSTGDINQNNAIAINETLLLGDDIVTMSPYSVRLNNGVYDISFSTVALSSEDGLSSITLFADNSPTNISSSQSTLAGNSNALSARGIYVSTINSIELRLVNTSTIAQQFSNLNFVISKIS